MRLSIAEPFPGVILFFMVLPQFAWMNVYDRRFSALTLPGQGELRNKEQVFTSLRARKTGKVIILRWFPSSRPTSRLARLAARNARKTARICSFVEQLALARPAVFSPIQANSGRTFLMIFSICWKNHQSTIRHLQVPIGVQGVKQ